MTNSNDNTEINKAEFDKRALEFITEAANEEIVYVLVHEGLCVHTDSLEYVKEDDEPMEVIPVWTKSYTDGAKIWAEDYASLEQMPISHFIEEFLPEIEENHCSIGLNWDENGVGRELPPYEIVKLLVRVAQGEKLTVKDVLG